MHNNDHDPHDLGEGPIDDREGASDAQRPLLGESADTDHRTDKAAINESLDESLDESLEESLIEESLHHALSDLEQMLERRQGAGESTTESVVDGAGIDEEQEQYVIPLLDEVVIAGTERYARPAAAQEHKPLIDDDDEPALRRRIAERLASEVEVITQGRIEAALETAREQIRVRVRNHLDIMLPEIVEELNQRRQRSNDNRKK